MTNLVQWVGKRIQRSGNPSGWPSIGLDQALLQFGQFGYGGLGYGGGIVQTLTQNQEQISSDFLGFINGAYKSNGPTFAVMMVRMLLFSEARFQWRRVNNGRLGDLFGTQDLKLLERPFGPNSTTCDLLKRAILDVDCAGNFYATRGVSQIPGQPLAPRIVRLRPDWVTILKGSNDPAKDVSGFDPTAELVGYVYQPGGPGSGLKPKFYTPQEVAHWAPIPDPAADYRGMSWLQPLVNEVLGDRAMTTHKIMYFEGGATPNLVVSMDTGRMDRKTFKEWTSMFDEEHTGAMNAYRTLYLGQGATAQVVGTHLKDLDYHAVQGQGETRIAAAGGVPPVIVGFSEGLEAATYSNYSQARRRLADGTLRPLWRDFAGSMEVLVTAPGGAQLWYDDRDIAFLKEDVKDNADIQLTKATAMRLLVDAGFDPDSIVKAIEANDFTQLSHSGLYSVQLHPPGSDQNDQNDQNDPDDDEDDDSGSGNDTDNDSGGENSKFFSGYLESAGGSATISTDPTMQLAQALIVKAGK